MQTFSVIENSQAEKSAIANQPIKLARADFYSLLQELRPAILRYCQRYLRNIDDAEEACQETLLKAIQGFTKFEGRASVKSWLYSIASNVCATHYQQRGRMDYQEDLEATPEEAQFTPLFSEPDDCLFNQLINNLSVQERNVLSFRFIEDLQLPEIANCLDLNISTVKMCYYRALDKFQLAQAS